MHRYIRQVVAVLVTACLAAVLSILFLGNREQTEVPGEQNGELLELKSEVARLRGEQFALARGVALGIQSSVRRTEPEAVPEVPYLSAIASAGSRADPASAVDPDIQQTRDEERVRDHIRRMDESVNSEMPDPQWTPSASKQLESKYSSIPDVTYSVQCGRTLCRVEFTLPKSGSVQSGMNLLTATMPWDGQAFYDVDGNGKGRFYYARTGFDLPKPGAN